MKDSVRVLPLFVPRAAHSFEPEPVDDVVRVCQELLERAERGEVIAVAVAAVLPDGGTSSAYSLGRGTLASLIGSLMQLAHRLASL